MVSNGATVLLACVNRWHQRHGPTQWLPRSCSTGSSSRYSSSTECPYSEGFSARRAGSWFVVSHTSYPSIARPHNTTAAAATMLVGGSPLDSVQGTLVHSAHFCIEPIPRPRPRPHPRPRPRPCSRRATLHAVHTWPRSPGSAVHTGSGCASSEPPPRR